MRKTILLILLLILPLSNAETSILWQDNGVLDHTNQTIQEGDMLTSHGYVDAGPFLARSGPNTWPDTGRYTNGALDVNNAGYFVEFDENINFVGINMTVSRYSYQDSAATFALYIKGDEERRHEGGIVALEAQWMTQTSHTGFSSTCDSLTFSALPSQTTTISYTQNISDNSFIATLNGQTISCKDNNMNMTPIISVFFWTNRMGMTIDDITIWKDVQGDTVLENTTLPEINQSNETTIPEINQTNSTETNTTTPDINITLPESNSTENITIPVITPDPTPQPVVEEPKPQRRSGGGGGGGGSPIKRQTQEEPKQPIKEIKKPTEENLTKKPKEINVTKIEKPENLTIEKEVYGPFKTNKEETRCGIICRLRHFFKFDL